MNKKALILTGPTAVGKTDLSLEIVHQLQKQHQIEAEIINADSMLVYRGMDIGTAKPSLQERRGIPHHLIDIRDPNDTYSAGDFYRDVHTTLEQLHTQGKRALIVGGTGFYLKALLYGIWDSPKSDPSLRLKLEARETADLYQELKERDPLALDKISAQDRYRIIRALEVMLMGGTPVSQLQKNQTTANPNFQLYWMERDKEVLQKRIQLRTQQMLAAGWIQEVESLLLNFKGAKALDAVGYRQIIEYLEKRMPTSRVIRPGILGLEDEICLATRQLVKRQRTWVKGQIKDYQSYDLGVNLDDLLKDAVSFYHETHHHSL